MNSRVLFLSARVMRIPFRAAVLLCALFLLIHASNVLVYRLLHMASTYLIGYIMVRDGLAELTKSVALANALYAIAIFSCFYAAAIVLQRRASALNMAIIVLAVVLCCASVPLFPERAFANP